MRLYYSLLFLLQFLIINVQTARLDLKDYMIAGALSTATTDFILYPLDTIKVTQQSNKDPLSFSDAAKLISRTGQGIRSFFNGAIGYAALDGCSAAVFFALYEETKVVMSRKLTGAALGLAAYPSAGIYFYEMNLYSTNHFTSFFNNQSKI